MIMGKPLPLAYIYIHGYGIYTSTPILAQTLERNPKNCERRRMLFVFTSTNEFQKSQTFTGIRKMEKALHIYLKNREGKRSLGNT
jgi:hypothetical protein